MQQSDVARMLASRPSGAALASLFSDHSEEPVAQPRRQRQLFGAAMWGAGRKLVMRAREVCLSQVPCEDFVFGTPAYFVRRKTQT